VCPVCLPAEIALKAVITEQQCYDIAEAD